jgi:lysyl-tRNA synthetase class 2
MELANGFSELTDADEQRLRFEEELDRIEQRDGARPPMPEKFLEDLERLDQAAGIAFGLDRLLMLLLSAKSIDEVVSCSADEWF